MDEKISLNYGEETVEIDVRGAASIETILPKPMEEITDLSEAFLRAVEQDAIGGVTLRDAVCGADEVTIVVSDITRSWMHQDRVMPLLVEYLHDRIGVPYEKMVILIAGHPPQIHAGGDGKDLLERGLRQSAGGGSRL